MPNKKNYQRSVRIQTKRCSMHNEIAPFFSSVTIRPLQCNIVNQTKRLQSVFVQQHILSVSSFRDHHIDGRVVYQETYECLHGVVEDSQEAYFT